MAQAVLCNLMILDEWWIYDWGLWMCGMLNEKFLLPEVKPILKIFNASCGYKSFYLLNRVFQLCKQWFNLHWKVCHLGDSWYVSYQSWEHELVIHLKSPFSVIHSTYIVIIKDTLYLMKNVPHPTHWQDNRCYQNRFGM